MSTEPTSIDQGRADAARHTERLAAVLRDTADRLDRHAAQLNRDGRPAAAIVADALSDYEQANTGPIIWQLITALGDAR